MKLIGTKGASGFFKSKITPTGLVTAAGFVACLATVAGMGGRFYWLLDLCSHFPFQYAGVLLLCSVVLVLSGKRLVAALFFFFAAVNGVRVLPQMIPRQEIISTNATSIRLLLVNVRTENKKFSEVRDLVTATRPDIAVFEEVNDDWMSVPIIIR